MRLDGSYTLQLKALYSTECQSVDHSTATAPTTRDTAESSTDDADQNQQEDTVIYIGNDFRTVLLDLIIMPSINFSSWSHSWSCGDCDSCCTTMHSSFCGSAGETLKVRYRANPSLI